MKKFVVILGIIMLVIISVIVAIPMMFQSEIQELAIKEANKNVNATITLGDVDLSLIPNFPKMTIEISEIAVEGKDEFQGLSLVDIESVTTTVDLMKLYNGELEIREVGLSGVDIHVLVLPNGKANYEIAIPESPEKIIDEPTDVSNEQSVEEETKLNLKLQRYFLHDFNLNYEDRAGHMLFQIENLNHEGVGDFSLSEFILETKTQVESINLEMEGENLLKDASLNSSINLAMNLDEMHFQFDTTFIQLNALVLDLEGWLTMPGDSMDMDLKLATKNNSFKELFSLVPNAYIAEYKDVQVKGSMSVYADVKGVYYQDLLPGFTIDVLVNDGFVQYPGLPVAAENIGINLHVNSPSGNMDRMMVNLKKAHLELAENYFDVSLLVEKTITNPTMNGYLKMDFDFASIPKMMPVEEGEDYQGKLKTDLKFQADMNSLDTEQYDRIEASGLFEAWDLVYEDESTEIPMKVQHVAMDFDLNQAKLTAFDVLVGKSDIHATGSLENFIPWYMNNETIVGELEIKSNYFNADEWLLEESTIEEQNSEVTPTKELGEESNVSVDSTHMETYEIPLNIDFTLHSEVKKIVYDSMDIQNLKGTITVQNGQVRFKNVSIEMFDGTASMEGLFDPTTFPLNPSFDFSMGIHNWEIASMANTLNSIDRLAPVLKSANGSLNTDIRFHGVMDSNLEPVLTKMNFNGNSKLMNLAVSGENLEKLNRVTKTTNYNPLKAKDILVSYKCVDGVLEVEPFDVTIGTQKATISGYTTLDQDINYIIDTKIKTSEMGAGADAIIGQVNSLLKSSGIETEVPEIIPVVISVTGKMDNPQFKPVFGKGEQSDDLKKQVKEVIQEQIEEVKEDLKKELQEEADAIIAEAKKQQVELMNQARIQAENLKKEAKKLGDQLKVEADKQGQELIKQATNPLAKIAATKGAEQLNKEADKKAKQLEQEAEKQGKNLILEAQNQSDKIIADAEKRAEDKIKGL